MNPLLAGSELRRERQALGEAEFRREYLAEFGAGDREEFFEADALAAVTGRYRELPPDEVAGAVAGLDFGIAGDATGLVIVGRSPHDRKLLVVCHVARFKPVGSRRARRFLDATRRGEAVDRVLDAVAEAAIRYGASVVADQASAGEVVRGLQERGVHRVTVRSWTGASREQAFRQLRARVYSGRISLPDDADLLGELDRLRTRLKAGASTVDLTRQGGSHLDLAMALAGAVGELDRKGAPRPLRTSSMLRGERPSRGLQPEPEVTLGLPLTTRTAVYRSPDGSERLIEGEGWRPPWRRG
jgi:phage terminase large subunit-like protein